jgi:hypothetical protein
VGIAMEHFGVVQALASDLFPGLEDALALALNAEKVCGGRTPGHFDEESPLVTADIDLERWGRLSLPAKRK